MKQPSREIIEALSVVSRQHLVVRTWFEEWNAFELARLPTVSMNTAVAQGRCQVLGEIVKLIETSPALAAQPEPGSRQ